MQNTILTVMPPPQMPGMTLACLVMCPSARYFHSPPGKSRRMLAITESVPSTSRQGPTMRLHLPTHMACLHGDGEEEGERTRLPSAPSPHPALPPPTSQGASNGNATSLHCSRGVFYMGHNCTCKLQVRVKTETKNKQTNKENNYPHAHQPPGCVYAKAFKITKRSQQQDHVISYLFKLNSILIPIYCGQEIFLNFS